MALSPGALVAGKYRVERLLGQGAMGAVWEATHTLTDRGVALKVLTEDPSAEASVRILREARALGRIQCKNVIEIFDVGELQDGQPFLVMQLLKGETLEERLDRLGKLPRDELKSVAVGIATALAAAHEVGVVHRDLKPGNVFLHWEPGSTEPVVKVLDFGISKLITQREATFTDAGKAVGSPAYMSPEQARAESIDVRTDVWSFGVVLFESLTGRLPFSGDTPYAMVAEILHGPMPDFARLCPDAGEPYLTVLARTVVRDRTQRAPSAAALLALLEQPERAPAPQLGAASTAFDPRSSEPASPAMTQHLAPPAEPPRRGGVGIVVGALLGVALAIGLGVVWLRREPSAGSAPVVAASSTGTPARPEDAGSGAAPAGVGSTSISVVPAPSSSVPEATSAASAASASAPAASPAPRPRYVPPVKTAPTKNTGRVRLPDGPG